ncbi:hypothetical protein SELMODRAFT_406739 [Selaginella moellendorffii]|uniref:Uncharacterized protein n=1 Tax=Selaginella moellendorffii TaxID=88036 RepID=D8R1B1_SELML|nr:hypothetical protein SELMODRAFT_406739 [Selaginella moellendorffii]
MVDSTRLCILGGVTDPEWSAAKFNEVMVLMTSSDDGVVEWAAACDKVFGGDQSVLKAMQTRGVIHVHYAPNPGGLGFAKFIMPLSPPHLEAMRQHLAGEESEE